MTIATGPPTDGPTFLESILQSSTEYSIVAEDCQGKVTLWNEGACRIYGYSPDQVLGKHSGLLSAPDDIASGRMDEILALTSSEGKWEGVLNRRRQSGAVFPARVVITVLKDQRGQAKGYLFVSKDVTEEVELQRAIVESQEYTRGLIEASVDALMTTDTRGIITDVNHQVEELTGRPRSELIGTPLKNYFADPGRAEDGVRLVLKEDRITNFELSLRAANGRETLVAFNATTLRGRDGKLRGVFAAVRDVTEQKQLESQLRESQTYTRGLIESSVEGLVTVDNNGVITDLNHQMADAVGYAKETLLSSRFVDCFLRPEVAAEALRSTLESGSVRDVALSLRTRTGERRDALLTASISRDIEGRARGVFVSIRDVTVQKRLQEELEDRNRELEIQNRAVLEANRLKSEFLAGMSHELRTPLDSIIGFSEFMLSKDGMTFTAEQREYLGDILNSGNHLLQLINDILDLARVESGKLDIAPEKFSPQNALNEVQSVVKPMIVHKQIQLRVHVAPQIESVVLDPLRFKQIVYNLLSNALKFTGEGGSIGIEIAPHGPHEIEVKVEDTGIGIAPEDLPRLFREFEQLEAGPGRTYQGSGLGLSLTKKLVEMQQGSIRVRSVVGRGSTFTVVLPTTLRAGVKRVSRRAQEPAS